MIAHLKKKRPHKKVEEILLYHYNAHPHVAHTVVEFWEKRGIRTVHTLDTAQTLFHMISGYYQKLKKLGLSRISTSLKLWKHDVKSWVKMDYHLSSKNGRNNGSSALHWRGIILKRSEYILTNKYIFLPIDRFSHYFLNSLVLLIKSTQL